MTMPLCWTPREVLQIINTEAEAIPSVVFRAVHSARELRVSGFIGTNFHELQPNHFRPISQDGLLAEFLRPEAPYSRLVVYGRSGSGKSHLIHWLKLNIPTTSDRLVVVVPKAGTSLRAILEMLIGELPVDRQESFRDALSRTGEAVATRQGQKERLLNEIAYAIGELEPSEHSLDRDLEAELIKNVPYLFQDVHFRQKHFYADGNLIADLVDHVFAAPSAYRPAEQRRMFTLADLPIDPIDFKDAAALAQTALQYLYSIPGAPEMAVDMLNRCLELAISRTLSFSGDRLVELMVTLRRHLKEDGRELVLLIEDFARVQGLDRALLQAMIDQGQDSSLCKLRWAIAVTTGFFEQVVDTVYTRITHFVNMDRSTARADVDLLDQAGLAAFAGPYLNAVRLGPNGLQAWEAQGVGARLPNACEECPLKTGCHQTFGHTPAGHGLFPFTPKALWNMAQRADDQLVEAFNPRTLQTGVLTPVLDDYGPSLPAGEFPPPALLERLGGFRAFDAAARSELRRRAGAEEGRVGAFLELWDGSGRPLNLPQDLREAFGIPTLGDVADAPGDETDDIAAKPVLAQPASGRKLTREEVELEAWARGEFLDKAPDTLRPMIFEAVSDAVDWDDLGLEKSRFCGNEADRMFRRRSIVFDRQGTTELALPLTLRIPHAGADASELDRTVVGLSGLVSAKQHGSWDFVGGSEALAAYLEILSSWKADVEGQLRAFTAPQPGWDLVTAAIELLAVQAVLSGRVKAEADTVSDVSAILAEKPGDASAMTQPLGQLNDGINHRHSDLRGVVRALNSGSKGGEVGTLISPTRIASTLRRLRSDGWRLKQTPPAQTKADQFPRISVAYQKAKDALEAACDEERAARLQWLDEMEAAFGVDAKRAAIITSLRQTRDAFADEGLAGRTTAKLDEALNTFQTVLYDDAVQSARSLRTVEDSVASLPTYARARSGALVGGRDLITAATAFLNQGQGYLAEQANRINAEDEGVLRDIQTIEGALETISDALLEWEASDAA